MTIIRQVSGRGIHLRGHDIDTDRIIPARFLRCVTFDGLGDHAFKDDRSELSGQHAFDLPHHNGATVLVVNRNFGCGSSREHAPQALSKWGIQAIVGESFAEIFLGNCLAIGIPCLTAHPDHIEHLQTTIEKDPQHHLIISIETLTVHTQKISIPVQMGADAHHQMFVSGTWDSCAQLISDRPAIEAVTQTLPYLAW